MFIALGHATMKLYSDDVKKSVLKSGVEGYGIGKNIETTHVEVSHEYGNTYSVSSYTENKGCLFALLAGGGRYLLWVIYCAYAGPFVTVKKIKASQENVKKYEAQIS